MKKNVQKLYGKSKGITLIALIITIIILLILAGVTISTLTGENGLLVRAKQAKKAHIQSEMMEQLTLALNELQVDKEGNASLDDVTQEWINTVISKDYNSQIKEDASFDGKMVVMNKNDVTGKFLISQKLEISKTEYNVSTLEFEYETGKLENGKVKILMKITDKVNGITQIDYPDPSEKPLIMNNRKEPVGIDYSVELGKEYKFVITTGDENKTEKIIKIDDYYYNITKDLGESSVIDNKATKAAYNKTYEATITTEGNYTITGLTVTMDGQNVTTYGNNIVDINTGKIKIEKVTGDIDIKVTTKKLEIITTQAYVNTTQNATSSANPNSVDKSQYKLYVSFIATLEGQNCTIEPPLTQAITSNGKYTYTITGTYQGKTITTIKEVTVDQYKSAQNLVAYDAGEWTKNEIDELDDKKLYDYNESNTVNGKFKLNDDSGLNFTFGGFKVGNSRNNSVRSGGGTATYDGWQLLKTETKTDENGNIIKNEDGKDRIYVTKIVHAGSSENFVCAYTAGYDMYRAEYLLSNGKSTSSYLLNTEGTIKDEFKVLNDGKTTINTRNWDMYKDKILDKKGYIKEVHLMTYKEASNITENNRNIGSYYWLENVNTTSYYESTLWIINNKGQLHTTSGVTACWGIRPVVEMNDGVYIASGSGTESDPYVLGKD